MSCNCDYSVLSNIKCKTCLNVENANASADIKQKRIWKQVRVPSSTYATSLSSITSAANRLASGQNTNWNQMSDRVSASIQTATIPSRGNSLHTSLTRHRPGASAPGGKGVDVKHDSYARYLNRKKASNLKTQTQNISSVPLYGNKTKQIGLVANSINCCA
jgi:hypothetical protein